MADESSCYFTMISKEEVFNIQSTWYAADLWPLLLSAGLPGLHTVGTVWCWCLYCESVRCVKPVLPLQSGWHHDDSFEVRNHLSVLMMTLLWDVTLLSCVRQVDFQLMESDISLQMFSLASHGKGQICTHVERYVTLVCQEHSELILLRCVK